MAHPVPDCEPGADPWTAGPDGQPRLRHGLAVDGKAMRGADGADGKIPYQLAVATHTDTVVVGERAIGPKSNEVPAYQPLLRTVAETTDLPVGCSPRMPGTPTARPRGSSWRNCTPTM